MKKLMILAACLGCAIAAQAQKRPLDEAAYEKWKYVAKPQMSPDGQWISFEHRTQDSLQVLYLWNNGKADTLKECKGARFSGTSRYLTYYKKEKGGTKPEQVYWLRNLENGDTERFADVTSFGFLDDKGDWIKLVRQNELPDSLKKKKGTKADFDVVLYHPLKKDSVCFRHLSMNRDCPDGKGVLLRSKEGWRYHNPAEGKTYPLPLGEEHDISLVNFSKQGNLLACLYKPSKEKEQRILIYNLAKQCLIDSLSSASGHLPEGFEPTAGRLSFSADGKSLFFRIQKKAEIKKPAEKPATPAKPAVVPQIWRWNDTSNFLAMGPLQERESYFCSLSLGKKKALTKLNSPEMPYLQFPDGESEALTIGFSDVPYRHLAGIEQGSVFDSYLVDMTTGKQTKVLEHKYYNPTISTDKRYIAWFEPDERAWFSMDTRTMEKRNLTASIEAIFHNTELDRPMHDVHCGSLGWTKTGHSLFINSKYDWWLVDASGKQAPVCLTKGVGAEKGIVLRPIKTRESERYYNPDDTFYLTAFQPSTKKSGFYRLRGGELTELVFSDHHYSGLKLSEDGKKCIWRRERFDQYPELYTSDADFKQARRVSVSDELHKEYLWGTSELVEWRTFQGETRQGILCKPENFDPAKKYPMLVYFYERKSDNLHKYNMPVPIGTVINWSYCVSNGYLVFVPDVTFRTGDPGRSSYDCIVSGVKALADRYSFIDTENIGLSGHSWGGYQSAFLVTQTNMFKAAVSGAPVVNMTSAYGGMRWGSGKPRGFQYEYGQSRMGGTLWEKPMEYIRNSPLFLVPQIKTPLLIMHNDKDGSVPWEQGIEFFLALRRLGKPAWMFNYKGQDHKLLKWEYRMDYSRRVMAFYDYYLKGGKKPEWM